MVAAHARTAIRFSLTPGKAHDTPEGRKLFNRLGKQHDSPRLNVDRACQGGETRQLALRHEPVVPPLQRRVEPWQYGREVHKRRNKIEWLFRRMQGLRRIFSLVEKFDVVFLGFVVFALIVEAVRSCEQGLERQ